MDMRELYKNLGETKNYYGGASCCFGQHCQGLLYVVLQTTSKHPFVPSHVIN
jgi:hypothetical protein